MYNNEADKLVVKKSGIKKIYISKKGEAFPKFLLRSNVLFVSCETVINYQATRTIQVVVTRGLFRKADSHPYTRSSSTKPLLPANVYTSTKGRADVYTLPSKRRRRDNWKPRLRSGLLSFNFTFEAYPTHYLEGVLSLSLSLYLSLSPSFPFLRFLSQTRRKRFLSFVGIAVSYKKWLKLLTSRDTRNREI